MPALIPCVFCDGPLPDTDKSASLGDQVRRCPRCQAAYVAAGSLDEAQARLADALQTTPARLALDAVVAPGSGLMIFVGWDPDEELRPSQVAKLLDLHPSDVNHRLRLGRFEGAWRDEQARNGVGEWRVPRRSILAFKRAGRKHGTGGPRPATKRKDGRLAKNKARHLAAKTKRSANGEWTAKDEI